MKTGFMTFRLMIFRVPQMGGCRRVQKDFSGDLFDGRFKGIMNSCGVSLVCGVQCVGFLGTIIVCHPKESGSRLRPKSLEVCVPVDHVCDFRGLYR